MVRAPLMVMLCWERESTRRGRERVGSSPTKIDEKKKVNDE